MIDLAVGAKFYYKGKLCKVVETEYEYRCSECALSIDECSVMNCASVARKDGKNICFKWVEDTKATEDIEETEETGETMNKATVNTEDCNREKTLVEEISELNIDESLKARILKKIANLEKRNDEFAEVVNRYRDSTQRLEQAIVMLATTMADNDESIMRDELIHLSGLYPDYQMSGEKGRECMEERKTSGINPKAICNNCRYADSCEEVLRGLEMLECSMYRDRQEE